MSLTFRPATASDHAHITRWYPALNAGDAPPPEDVWLEVQRPDTSIAELGREPAGFCYTQRLDGEGYVRQIVIDGALRGRGLGRAFLMEVARELRAEGIDRWRLNVDPLNTAAITLYRSLGFEAQHEGVALRFDWTWLDSVEAADTGAEAVAPEADALESLGAHFGLPAGQLTGFWGQPGTHIRALVDGTPRALAVFDTGFPGCFPFSAETYEHAVDLLRALRPLAVKPDMGIVLLGAPEVDAAFVGAGARAHLRFLHMVGALPADGGNTVPSSV